MPCVGKAVPLSSRAKIMVVATDHQFGLFEVSSPAQQQEPADPPITEDQIRAIREAFDAAEITSMVERKSIIESCTIRPVDTIRDVYAREAGRILRRIEQRRAATAPTTGSAWDNRVEDTWIDKL